MHVWLYIFSRGVEFNPLSNKGLERIGCWLCPAALESEFEGLRRTHPELHGKWKVQSENLVAIYKRCKELMQKFKRLDIIYRAREYNAADVISR
jgi:3'-phosphoadenosine 5'-phosphosulfate sulfotransferase (PAPS reductase)/FAD synthetase